ncbi:gliding motility regulatory protein [bacterium BMS3Bbin01]|nr:gliding motility regulatory protein [bacterium BMS3Bbin01]
MDLSSDAELLAIFREELTSRAEHLVEGARALRRGGVDPRYASDLFRDAHTIKGSSRMMGFEALGEAGEVLEFAWRSIADGSQGGAIADLAACLGKAASLLIPTLDADPIKGTPQLREAIAAVKKPVSVPEPESTDAVDPPAANLSTPADLGGLLSAVERGLIGSATRVDTNKLYRMINRAAEARLDADALSDAVRALRLTAGNPREVASLAARWESAVESMDDAVRDLQDRALELVSERFGVITSTFPQFVHYLARRTGKEVHLELTGAEVEVDRQILEHLREPLRHLVVNAVDHGIESPAERAEAGKPTTGRVVVRAAASDGQLRISVEDDGRGIDWSVVRNAAIAREINPGEVGSDLSGLLFRSGFSTVAEPSDLSGDGAGLALVAELADHVNGGITIESRPGAGTSLLLTLPLSWSFQDLVLLRSEGRVWGIPAAAVVATVPTAGADVRPSKDRMEFIYQGNRIPISSFAAAIGAGLPEETEQVVVLATRAGRVAVTVPEVLGRQQVAVKGLGPVLAGAPFLTGAAVLGGGEVVAIVDPNRLADQIRALPIPDGQRPRVLAVDDSKGVRQLVAAVLGSQGYDVVVARNAEEGLEQLEAKTFDALVVDFAMPGPDGVELVKAVRRRLPALPVLMVSGVATAADQSRAWEAGVDAYLDKSDLRQGLLVSTLASLLALRNGSSLEVRP